MIFHRGDKAAAVTGNILNILGVLATIYVLIQIIAN